MLNQCQTGSKCRRKVKVPVFGGSYGWRGAQTLFAKQTLDEVIQGER